MTTAIRIGIALLMPFWWSVGLLILAWLGDVSASLRSPIRRLFERLERRRAESPTDPAISRAAAA